LTADIFFCEQDPIFLDDESKDMYGSQPPRGPNCSVLKAFREIWYYLQRGFRITTVHADGDFASQDSDRVCQVARWSTASANEHVPESNDESGGKGTGRATRHSLPISAYPKILTINIVLNVVKLNFFPTKGGVSETFSPKPSCPARL
jgi:hypothetical protein